MIKKFLLSIIILFIWYILLIFTAPNVAWAIEKFLWIDWFNSSIIELKEIFNEKSTNIPSTDELLSWAIDIKNTIVDWVDTTKEKIDTVRETLSWVENTYNEIKEWYNEVKNFIDTNSWKIEEIKTVIDTISELNNTWTTN